MGSKITLSVIVVMGIGVAVMAEEYGPVPRQVPPETMPRIASPPGPVYSLGTPSPQRPPIEVTQGLKRHHGTAIPQGPGGWSGYGFGGIPTYQWGYFGARYHPVKLYHRGYYGHRMSHGYRRGY